MYDIQEVSLREFTRHAAKYVNQAPINFKIIGRNREYMVTITSYALGILPQKINSKAEAEKKITEISHGNVSSYGCGCQKGTTPLCPNMEEFEII